MNNSGYKIGYWSALFLSFSGYLYGILYVVFLIVFPVKPWTNIQDFASNFKGTYMIMLTSIQVTAFIQSFCYFILSIVINHYVSEERKIISKIGQSCAGIFLALSSIHYYIQFTSVRFGILNGSLDGLGQFAQFNFDSPVSVTNILGWTFFLGVSNISFGLCFRKKGKGSWIRYGFLVNGICCIITAILFAIGIKSIMSLWTISLSITWYIYILITLSFKNESLELI